MDLDTLYEMADDSDYYSSLVCIAMLGASESMSAAFGLTLLVTHRRGTSVGYDSSWDEWM